MRVKWKCVWRVFKPKIIAALIVIIIVALFVSILILIDYYYVSYNPIYSTNISLQQQVISTSNCCMMSPMAIILPLLIIGGGIGIIFLSIEYLKALIEALKPCIIWEEE